jgi:uncharacterized protein (TIGR04141 family)
MELLTRLTPLQNKDPRRKKLDARLAAALRGEADDPLGTGWPWAQADEFAAVESVQLQVPGLDHPPLPWLSVDDLRGIVTQFPSRNPLQLLRAAKVMLQADDGEPASPWVPALKWVAFETRMDDTLFVFHDGRWLSVNDDYRLHVRAETERILALGSLVSLLPWRAGQRERDYNAAVASSDSRFLLLDRELIRTKMHPHGIEHCDLLGPSDEFIHVKLLHGSDDASHLFAQAFVATEQLLFDPEARARLATKVADRSGGARKAPEIPKAVVLAIGGRGRLSAGCLFTFSQVTLVRLVQQLEARGVAVQIVSIPTI